MAMTVRISNRSLRNPRLPLMLVAALLPLPMAMLAAAFSGPASSVYATGSPATPGSPAPSTSIFQEETQEQEEQQRKSLSRTASGTAFDDLDLLHAPWFGDLDGMIEREAIRVLVPMSKTFYFLDGPNQKGVSYDSAQQFEEVINERLERGHLKVHVVMVPVARDELIDGLVAGHGDLALGNITITDERRELVEFSDAMMSGISELVVTGPESPEINSLDDLAGREIYVRFSSSYYTHLTALNADFRARGLDEITLTAAPEVLEDEDLLEMVNAGLLDFAIVDGHKAEFWARIFEDLTVHEDIAVATGQSIAWAFRKDSPQMADAVNEFVVDHKKGTLLGNIAFNKYLKDTKWAKRALDDQGRTRLEDVIDIFRRYGEEYDLPWLLVAAQGYQESGLDQSVRSPAGAIGIMQLLPSTANDPNVGIPEIEIAENNIHAGTKYLRFVYDRYFSNSPGMSELDKALFSFAAYNAGPARVARLRGKAEDMGLDPNQWFRNVEIVAAQDIGRETVQYVSNIYKYFIAYERLLMMEDARNRVRDNVDELR